VSLTFAYPTATQPLQIAAYAELVAQLIAEPKSQKPMKAALAMDCTSEKYSSLHNSVSFVLRSRSARI